MKTTFLALGAALACHLALADTGLAAIAKTCATASAKPPRDPRIHAAVAEARRQHTLFGGQLIERSGSIAAVGFNEAEFGHPEGETTPTWQRVAGFWAAVDADAPPDFRAPAQRHVDRKQLMEQLAAAGAGKLDDKQLDAIRSAIHRSALIDHPWSAVFISFLIKQAGFRGSEFAFSDSHVDYVDQAVLASVVEAAGESSDHAWRACDVAKTKPRPGDLLCHTRGATAGTASYSRLVEELAQRRAGARPNTYPMHCDIVTRADQGGDAKIETIGGNVFQSVTLRKMTLNAAKTLGATYTRPGTNRCRQGETCGSNLSNRPWVVLLQFRG